MSSFPLHMSASLVLNVDVSLSEFFHANTLVTAVMSLKNVWCGAVLASRPQPSTLVVLAVFLTVSTFLPTAATVYITGKGIFIINKVSQLDTPEASEAPALGGPGCAEKMRFPASENAFPIFCAEHSERVGAGRV